MISQWLTAPQLWCKLNLKQSYSTEKLTLCLPMVEKLGIYKYKNSLRVSIYFLNINGVWDKKKVENHYNK